MQDSVENDASFNLVSKRALFMDDPVALGADLSIHQNGKGTVDGNLEKNIGILNGILVGQVRIKTRASMLVIHPLILIK